MSNLLVILHSGHLGESSLAEFTAVRLFPSVTSHMALQTGGLRKNFIDHVDKDEEKDDVVIMFHNWLI